MTEENEKKMNFFNRIITSIKDFDKYQIFALEKLGVSIKYLALIMLIFALLVSSVFTYKLSFSVNSGISYIKNNIKEISYKDGELTINSDEEIKIINSEEVIQEIIINTSKQEKKNDYNNEISKYQSGIILLNDRVIYKNEMLNQTMEYMYTDIIQANEFNKEDILNFIDNFNMASLYSMFLGVVFIYIYIIYFISTLLDAVMLAILGFIFARIVGIKIKFKATFSMGIYALTLPIILNVIYIMVNAFTGFNVKYFQWMYTTISYIYMIVAILMIKTDLINKQVELMKIVEEQEKVREELKRKEQEKKEKEKEEKKPEQDGDKEEKKKDKDNDKKDELGDSGLAPQQ